MGHGLLKTVGELNGEKEDMDMFKFLAKNQKNESKDAAEREKIAKMMKKIAKYAGYDEQTLYAIFSSSAHGLDKEGVEDSLDEYGRNQMDRRKKVSVFKRVWDSFINPFTLVLLSLAVERRLNPTQR